MYAYTTVTGQVFNLLSTIAGSDTVTLLSHRLMLVRDDGGDTANTPISVCEK